MNAEVKDYVVEKTHELMEAASCSKEAKEAAQAWLDALGTAAEAEETKKYIAELEEDIMPLEGLIAFAESDMESRFSETPPVVWQSMQDRSRLPERNTATARPARLWRLSLRKRRRCWLTEKEPADQEWIK